MRLSTAKVIASGVLVSALVLFPADGLRALGLGEARIDSYMGQPLDVTIRLVEPDAGSLDSLTVAPAVSADYDRLGVPTAALALGLEVSVDRRVDPPLIRVRSSRTVDDPVVQVLIDARWSSGRVLREYTLFLDPPTLPVAPPVRRSEPDTAPAREEPAEATSTPQAEPEPATEPRPRPAPSTSEQPVEPEPAAEPDPAPAAQSSEPEPEPQPATRSGPAVVGPVAAGQTLWSIAYAWRPDTGLTMNQVMLAILDRNPQAFIDGNVNRLRRGAELTMPDQAEVSALSSTEADRRMRVQMQSWRQDSGIRDVPVIAEAAIPEVDSESAFEPVAEDEESGSDVVHRLEVVPPEGETFEEGPAVSDGEVRRASTRLAELEDQMVAEGLENEELNQRIDSIRDAIETREMAGLAIADEEMAEFEARLRETREAREAAAELAATEDSMTDRDVPDDESTEDEVSAYFRQLEEELGMGDEATADVDDEQSGEADDILSEDDESLATEDQSETSETSVDTDEPVVAESETATERQEMPVAATRSQRGTPLWQWLLIGLAVLAVVGGVVWWMRGRRSDNDGVVRRASGADPAAARARVASDPANLAAHLALLNALAAADDREAFSDALDDMYRQVDDDEDPHWQQALDLAVSNAPNHPLLTPRETGFADDDSEDGLDDRTREMLGILDRPDDDGDESSMDDYEIDSDVDVNEELDGDEEFFSDEEEPAPAPPRTAERRDESDDDEVEGTDMDLAELSNRVDDDTGPVVGIEQVDPDEVISAEDDAADFAEDDEGELSDLDQVEETPKADDDADPLELDFAFTRSEAGDSGAEAEDDADSVTERDSDDDSDEESDDGEEPEVESDSRQQASDTLQLDEDELESFGEPAGSGQSADDTLQLDDDELDVGEVGDRELEAFLRQDDDDASASELDSDGAAEDESDDDGDATLSDDDAEVKLDLARAYISMDDPESARTLLEEIISGGSKAKRSQARSMLDEI